MSDIAGDIARSMATAPVRRQGKEKTVEPGIQFPLVSFRLVANPKAYEDRLDKSKSNTRIAYVDMVGDMMPFTVQGSIYLEARTVQREDGRHIERGIRFSLPKGIEFTAAIPVERIAEWKDSVIDQYVAWRKTAGGKVAAAAGKQAAGYRTLGDTD